MTTLELVELIVLLVVALALGVFYAFKAIKNGWVSKILSTINDAIKEAEKSGKTGPEKKAYVLQQAEKVCDELKIPYKIIESLVAKIIDNIVKDYNVIAKEK